MFGELVLQQSAAGGDIVSSVLVWFISLLIGALAIYAGAKLIIDAGTGYGRAVVTALIGAIVWAVIGFFFGWIPIVGPLLALIAWIGVINWQYPGGWGSAAAVGFVAWIVAIVALWGLSTLGIVTPEAVGIPGA